MSRFIPRKSTLQEQHAQMLRAKRKQAEAAKIRECQDVANVGETSNVDAAEAAKPKSE